MKSKMVNIVIPISKYNPIESKQDYPHNLIEISGSPLIELVFNNLKIENSRLIFVLSKDEADKHHTNSIIKILDSNNIVLYSHGPTAGAALTALLAVNYINNSDELIIAAGDQIINEDLNQVLNSFRQQSSDGGILTFRSVHPKWSYVETINGQVIKVQEKKVISNQATAGFFYFRAGSDFVSAAKNMILKRDHLNNNYYVSHTFNQLILMNKKIVTYEVDSKNYFKLSTPDDIESYRRLVEEK